ncbi:MAG: phospho-N-acetylmuramoyl-pentapeptide-transferase [Candidatus Saganbacteria bacterium]|nr:phospho-N-acetylmuramoyl-pentapeptide-transferase [Candidatus Saganbacteria bacterium]
MELIFSEKFLLLAVFVSAILVGCFIFCLPLVWLLRVLKASQQIRPEGPSSHYEKAGTPTMGGIAIILTILTFSLILLNVEIDIKYAGLMILMLGYALTGFVDDYIKIKRKANQGLEGRQKIFLQMLFALIFGVFLILSSHHESVGGILKILYFNSPILYLPLVMLICVATSNSVNLTDGLDGLAAGCLFVSFLAFALMSYKFDLMNEAIISMAAAGATLAFLPFNFIKAHVFMGDVGSLSLGGLLAGIAILLHKELLLIIVGGVFVAETLSVIIQVASFKIFHKRVFKMSPLHHHFELLGFPETTIVVCFWLAAAIFASFGAWIG